MVNIISIVDLLIPVAAPIGLGYLFRKIRLFNEKEINALRKFVIRVSAPFLIFKSLYEANMESLGQFFPISFGFICLTVLFMITGYLISGKITKDVKKQQAYTFSVLAGNYAYLGWGVMYSFLGEDAFMRAVFFTLLFWPVFLICGFWLNHKSSQKMSAKTQPFFPVLIKNAVIPLSTAFCAILLNVTGVKIYAPVGKFINDLSSITIPLILFTIGLNLSFKIKKSYLKIIIFASVHRLVLGFILGFLVISLIKFIFTPDQITLKVILLESIMPSATMSMFFAEYVDLDKKLMAAIIAFSTLLSLLTIPAWFLVVEQIFK